jgi:hypothetical protein
MSTGLDTPDSAKGVVRQNLGYLIAKVVGSNRKPITYLQFAARVAPPAFGILPLLKGDIVWAIIVMLFGTLWTAAIVEFASQRRGKNDSNPNV